MREEPILSKRRLTAAGVAALLGCAVCCAVPLLAVAGIGGGAVATLSSVFRPGSELWVGASVFVIVLVGMAVWNRLRKSGAAAPRLSLSRHDVTSGPVAARPPSIE